MSLPYDCIRMILSYTTLDSGDVSLGKIMKKASKSVLKCFLFNNAHLLKQLGWSRSFVINELLKFQSLHAAAKDAYGSKLLLNFTIGDLVQLKQQENGIIDFITDKVNNNWKAVTNEEINHLLELRPDLVYGLEDADPNDYANTIEDYFDFYNYPTVYNLDKKKIYSILIFLLLEIENWECTDNIKYFWIFHHNLAPNFLKDCNAGQSDLSFLIGRGRDTDDFISDHLRCLVELALYSKALPLTMNNALIVAFWYKIMIYAFYFRGDDEELDLEVEVDKVLYKTKDDVIINKLHYMILSINKLANKARNGFYLNPLIDSRKYEELQLYRLLKLSNYVDDLPEPL